MPRAGIRAGGAAVASSLALGLAMMMTTAACRAESLQDAWNAALAANQGLQAAQAGTASARSGVGAARAERLPTVTTVNAYTWLNNTPTFKSSFPLPGSPRPLSVSFPFLNREFFFSSTLMNIPLYTGGRITAGIDAAGAQAGAARAEEFTAAMDLKLEVTQAYLNVLRAEKILVLARSNVSSLQAHERDVRNLFREGVAKRTDLLSSQVSLARARQRVIQASNERDVARAAYNRLLGRPLTAPTALEEMALKSDFGPGESGRPDDVRKTSGPDKLPEALPGAAASHATEPEATIDPDGEAEIERLTATALSSRSELAALSHQAAAYAAQARGSSRSRSPRWA